MSVTELQYDTRPTVIVDLDGTLVDVSSIEHLVQARPKKFKEFQEAACFCPPNFQVLWLVKKLAEIGFTIVVFSGRSDKYIDLTLAWLKKYSVPFASLSMRPNGNFDADASVKRAMFSALDSRANVVLAIDDRQQIIELWRDLDIPVVRVPRHLEIVQDLESKK